MNKTLLFAAVLLVAGAVAGVAGRQALAPVKPPAAAEADKPHGETGQTAPGDSAHADPHMTDGGHGQSEAAHGTDASHGAPHGADAAHAHDAGTPTADPGAGAGPASSVDPRGGEDAGESASALRPTGASSDYVLLSQLIGKMSPAESATLLKHLDDDQAVALLQSMPLRQVNGVLMELPTGRSQRLKTRLFGAAGHL